MHRIDTEGATENNRFTDGDPTIPVDATVVGEDWLNAVQEEIVYAVEASGQELDKADNTQLFKAIQSLIPESFPTGTRMLFQQSAAPTGWVKESNVSYNDCALRIVTGNVGTGGSVAFSSAFSSKSYNVTGTTGATTLSVAQLAAHTHTVAVGGNTSCGNYSSRTVTAAGSQESGSVGSNYSHTHPMTSGSTTINLAVKRADVIICIKS